MIESGIEAVLVKVAALGLDPHRHLGRTLAAMEPALHSLRDRFGCNVCGEGGEYETLTLDCPAFRRGRIVLEGWDVAMHSPDAVAPVGVLQPAAFRVERKGGGGNGGGASDGDGAVPEAAVVEVPRDWQPPPLAAAPVSAAPPADTDAAPPPVAVRAGARHAHVLCAPVAAGDGPPGANGTAAAVHAALRAIGAALPGLGLTWDDSLFVHLYLSDMAQFAAANAAYCKHLPRLSPPSRACVQLPLLGDAPLAVDVLFVRRCPQETSTGRRRRARRARRKGGEAAQMQRRVLHVQSVSDWAPSCIGPYSQV
jgi:diphthine-ammonia ligase